MKDQHKDKDKNFVIKCLSCKGTRVSILVNHVEDDELGDETYVYLSCKDCKETRCIHFDTTSSDLSDKWESHS